VTTKWAEIADAISDRIEAGTYPAGDKIPSIPTLMEEFDAARDTVRDAVSRLANMGLVTPLRGVGTIVRDTTPVDLSYAPDKPAQIWAAQTGEAPSADRVVSAEWETADAHICERLRVPKGSQVVHRVRHQSKGKQIAQIAEQWIPDHVVTAIQNATGDDLADASHEQSTDLFSQMRAAGNAPALVIEKILTRMPDVDEMEILQIARGVPVLITHRVTRNVNSEPLETSTFTGAGDRMSQQFEIPLSE
jgi:GntR family transcriptional regulator